MADIDWFNCRDPRRMLDLLCDEASDRKLRLCLTGLCRCIWYLLQSKPSRRAVERAEEFADELVAEVALESAHQEAWEAYTLWPRIDVLAMRGARAAGFASKPLLRDDEVMQVLEDSLLGEARRAAEEAAAVRVHLLRDIFDSMFVPIEMDQEVLAWQDRAVVKLAQAAYNERELPDGHLDPDKLAVLADALEEAGCTSEEILVHLRAPGVHVRGCWAVDLLLGKK